MLRVSLHAGPLDTISRFNQIAWVDIGYQQLAQKANYKVLLFEAGKGASPPATLKEYPRWSGTLWDLTARAIAVCLNGGGDEATETVPEVTCNRKRSAFLPVMSAVIEHLSIRPLNKFLASALIHNSGNYGKHRSTYRAVFTEHTLPDHRTAPFEFKPGVMRPAELLMHACLMRVSGTQEMPPRPPLCLPDPLVKDGKEFVLIHRLVEPARTGFKLWLNASGQPPEPHEDAPMGIAPSPLYLKFLEEVV